MMKLIALLMLVGAIQVSAAGFSQITLIEEKSPLEKVFKKIQKETGYSFLYSYDVLKKAGDVSITLKNVSLERALNACVNGNNLTYAIVGKTIIIKAARSATEIEASIQESVTGKVIGDDGIPLSQVSVTIKGTNIGTTTDTEGNFILKNVSDNATLVFTSVNTQPTEVPLKGRSDLGTIKLKTRISENQDVTVISTGYQTISKERATGSYGKVTEEVISKRPFTNLANALVGQVAGLVSDPSTGFTIRGRSSLSGSGDRIPLLVVDGFPIEGGFSTINPNDVKSVDILKDAAATSIYGARAANGVIVVTTKGYGSKGRINVQYNSFVAVSEKIDLDYYMNMADASAQIAFTDRLYNTFKSTNNAIYSDPYTTTQANFRGSRSDYVNLLIERDKGNITQEYFNKRRNELLSSDYKDDFEKYLLRNGLVQQHNLIISGTNDKNSYKFSALLDNDLTALQFNNNTKTQLGFTNVYNISDKIKYTFNTTMNFWDNSNNGVNLGHAKSVLSPWSRLVDDNGNYTRMNYQNYEPRVQTFENQLPYHYRYNLLEESVLRENNYRAQDIRIQNDFEFKIAKGLNFRPMVQYELMNYEDHSLYDERSYAARNYSNWVSKLDTPSNRYISQIPRGGILRNNGTGRRTSIKLRAVSDYNRSFDGKHEVTALLGGEVIATRNEVGGRNIIFGYNKSGLNYPLFDYAVDRYDMFNTGVIFENSMSYEGSLLYDFRANNFRQNNRYNERFITGFFNSAYTFNKKYTATISMRTDASNYVSRTVREKFSPFFSAGLRWNVLSEKFMKNADFIDKLALRATYGITGNAAGKTQALSLSVFSSIPPYTETGNLNAGVISGRDNDFLTWEKTYQTDIGADFSLFRGKLNGNIDVYRRHSKDLLAAVQTSLVLQSTSSLNLNLSEVMNKGIEISLGTKLDFTRNLSWDGRLVADYNQNEVLGYNYIWPNLYYYLGSNAQGFIPGLPTDRLMMVKIVGTTREGYFVQQKKNGELVVANNAGNVFSDFSSFGNGRPPANNILVKDDDRMYYMGRTTPPATLGFTNNLTYKGFSFFSVITGRFGYKFTSTDESLFYSLANNNYSASGLATLMSTSLTAKTETGNTDPNLINVAMLSSLSSLRNSYSDQVVHDASHIRLNELYFGYDFSQQSMASGKRFFRSLTLYAQLRNLGVLWRANDIGVDPEFRRGTIQPRKTITIGARIGL